MNYEILIDLSFILLSKKILLQCTYVLHLANYTIWWEVICYILVNIEHSSGLWPSFGTGNEFEESAKTKFKKPIACQN